MAVTSPRFPDVQLLLADDLEALAGVGHTGVETPTDLASVLPFIRVVRTGGSSTRFSDRAMVDVDVFAGSYTAAETLAELVRQRLVGPPPSAALLDRVECTIAARELPWDDDGLIRRWGGQYEVVTRRRVMA